MAEIFLLAIASAFWPALLAVDVIALRAEHPARLLLSFLAGGLLTTMTIGLVVIYALQGSSLTGSSKHSFDAAVTITVGALALLAAVVLARRYLRPGEAPTIKAVQTEPGRMERMLDRGAPLAFAAGILFNIIPGVFPLVALKDIAELDYGVPGTVATVLGFYLIMFTFIEVPLVGYQFAPERTSLEATRFNAWVDRNAKRVAIYALGVVGVYLIVRGTVKAVGS